MPERLYDALVSRGAVQIKEDGMLSIDLLLEAADAGFCPTTLEAASYRHASETITDEEL